MIKYLEKVFEVVQVTLLQFLKKKLLLFHQLFDDHKIRAKYITGLASTFPSTTTGLCTILCIPKTAD